jgi:tetratricopeptide (TPR) repeat protein
MSMCKLFAAFALTLLLAACATPNAPTPPSASTATSKPQTPDDDAGMDRRLERAGQWVLARKSAEALPLLDEVIAHFERKYRNGAERAYSARSPAESLLYLLEASKAQPPTGARVYAATWGQAYFLKGYALVELRRLDDAKAALTSAIDLAPHNSQYRSERGQVYAYQRDWRTSLQEFRAARDAAEFTPPELKNRELTRALRGMAFAEVELQNLDEAEAIHKRVLQIDPNDAISLKELRYIRTLRARKNLSPGPTAI